MSMLPSSRTADVTPEVLDAGNLLKFLWLDIVFSREPENCAVC